MEIVEHLLNVCVERPMDRVQLRLLLLTERLLELMEEEVNLARDKLCTLVIRNLDARLILKSLIGIGVSVIHHELVTIELLVRDAVIKGVESKE